MNEVTKDDFWTKPMEYETDRGPVKLTGSYVTAWLTSGGHEPTKQDVVMFLNLCKYQKLNPFLREAYLVKYSTNQPAQIVVSKTVFEKRAAEDGRFDGMQSGIIFLKGEEIVEREGGFILPTEQLVGGWAIGHRKDWKVPKKVTVSLQEYIGKKSDGEINRMWKEKPATMIVKVAESQLLRAVIPKEMQGLYSSEEMTYETKPPEINVSETYQAITKLIEDNRALLSDTYCDARFMDLEASKTPDELNALRDTIQDEVKRMAREETKIDTKEGFTETATRIFKGTVVPANPGKPIPDSLAKAIKERDAGKGEKPAPEKFVDDSAEIVGDDDDKQTDIF